MAKEKRASWFKLFLHQKPLLDAVPDETVGKAVKAAMAYFEDGTIPSLDTLESVIFLSIKPYIEEANSDYEKKSENGKKGGRPKKQTKPEVISQKQNEPEITEAEADAEADADAEAVQVYATDGVIYINGYEGEVKVVNAAGQVVKDVMVNGAEQLNVNAGLYMVVTGNQVTKAVVK